MVKEKVYMDGYNQASNWVAQATREELIDYLEGLYGLARLLPESTTSEIRVEAQRQCKLNWLNSAGEGYEELKLWLEK
jgi:hypothetical protein